MTGVAVITGGASGIGRACAEKLAGLGHQVAVLDINAEGGEETVRRVQNAGGVARFFACDVSEARTVEACAQAIDDAWGTADVLVMCAALIPNTEALLDMDPERHDRMWQVNYHGAVNACRSFAKRMRDRGTRGAIVTIGSINGDHVFPLPAYNVSKVAIHRLTQLLAAELGPHGIRVNCVAPTFVKTEGLQQKIDQGQRSKAKIMEVHALDDLPGPENIADSVVFLCSEQASHITGAVLPVDSGYAAAVSYNTYAGGVPWREAP